MHATDLKAPRTWLEDSFIVTGNPVIALLPVPGIS